MLQIIITALAQSRGELQDLTPENHTDISWEESFAFIHIKALSLFLRRIFARLKYILNTELMHLKNCKTESIHVCTGLL